MRKLFAKTLVAASVAGTAFAVQAQEVTLKVHHFLSPTTIIQTGMFGPWCEKLAKESANKLKCQIYPAMQLGGSPAQLYDQAKDGVADVTWVPSGYAGNRFSTLSVFELPFMMTNADATSRALWEYYNIYAKDMFKDVHMLGLHVHGPGVVFTSKKQISTTADFKGLKMRGPTPTVTALLAKMGATPVGMPVTGVAEALSKGVVDGAVIPYQVAPSVKVTEIAKFAAETDPQFNALYTTVFLITMNKAKYDSLPPDLKKVLDANSGLEFSAFMGRTQAADDTVGRKIAVDAGMKINMIPAAELANWKKATDEQDDEWVASQVKAGRDGKKMLQTAQDLIKKHTKK
jgi:TRAP-type C4-dicarboxylate transport system substrate-binding protein